MVLKILLIATTLILSVAVINAVTLSSIENIKLRKVMSGSPVGNEITSKTLFKSPSTVVFAVRRPG